MMLRCWSNRRSISTHHSPGPMWNRVEQDLRQQYRHPGSHDGPGEAMPMISRRPKKNPVGRPPSASGIDGRVRMCVALPETRSTIRSGSPATTAPIFARGPRSDRSARAGVVIGFQVKFPPGFVANDDNASETASPPTVLRRKPHSRRLDRGMGEGSA